jgi:hypothetical protein
LTADEPSIRHYRLTDYLMGMELDLTADETAALERLLSDAIDRDR